MKVTPTSKVEQAGRDPAPLFVTRFSLSSRTAIGVQTRLMLEHFPASHHVYWNRYELRSQDWRSQCAENTLIARSTKLRNTAGLMRLLSSLDVAFWDGDKPTRRGRRFFEEVRDRTISAYFAPIDTSDATRMQAIAEILDRPFAVHYWDLLDDGLRKGDRPTRWLAEKARAVFCGSGLMLDEMRLQRPDAELLLFARHSSMHAAVHRPDVPPKIVLMGDIVAYRDGVAKLLEAVRLLRARGSGVTVRFIGRPSYLKQAGVPTEGHIESVGFLQSDEARDRAIAECDIGFLPGPLGDPELDYRSRYSIPSRVLDYLAVGVPILGSVHPKSATYRFCHDLGLGELAACTTSDQIAAGIQTLSSARTWIRLSNAAKGAFAALNSTKHFDDLERALR